MKRFLVTLLAAGLVFGIFSSAFAAGNQAASGGASGEKTPADDVILRQGNLELSNVKLSEEMTDRKSVV